MKWLSRPDVWFILAVLLLAAGGATLLNTRACKSLDERDWQYYTKMNAWRSTCDAVSATCGVGLLMYDLEEEYTPRGRWLLTALGVAGALLFLAAAWQAAGRLRAACGERVPLPPIWSILVAFVILLGLSVPVVAGLEWLTAGNHAWPSENHWSGAAWRAMASFASLGWLPGSPPRSCTWIYAAVGLIGGLGWMVWLLPWGTMRRRCLYVPRVLALAGGYLASLLLLAALIFALEAPRGGRDQAPPGALPKPKAPAGLAGDSMPALALGDATTGQRYARSLVQTVCASAAGIPTETMTDRNITEGTKVVLATTMLVGPLGGAAGGGIKFTLLIWVLSGTVAAFAARGRSIHPATFRCLLAGIACFGLLVLLTFAVALGLLIIETHTASLYQARPTFADAFLDAASAVAGGNLSSGLVEHVTARNLSSGIRQSVDLYQYGMAWLIAAMVLGRVLPLFVLCRMAGAKLHETRRGTPPLV